jgi:membrane protease subunit (stomatin/prohibitin family)
MQPDFRFALLNNRFPGQSFVLVGRLPGLGGVVMVMAAGVVEVLRYRIHAAAAQRLAAQNPPARQQTAAPGAEANDCNPCIISAAGVKATSWTKQWTDPALV